MGGEKKKKKSPKNHRISSTSEGQSSEWPKSCFPNLGWVNCVQTQIFDDRAWEKKKIKKTYTGKIHTELILK